MPNTLTVRTMQDSDVAAVYAIEHSAQINPWTAEIFAQCLRVGYEAKLLLLEQTPVGFAIYQYIVDECHLLNIAIEPEQQGRGLGQYLLSYVIQQARDEDMVAVYLEVRTSNQAATHLYKKNHFEQQGVRKNYYTCVDGREDALLFRLSFNT